MIGFEETLTEATQQVAADIEVQARLCLLRAARHAERRELALLRNQTRPSVVLQAALSSHITGSGDLIWTASYGSLFAAGRTPDEAFSVFDEAWSGGVV